MRRELRYRVPYHAVTFIAGLLLLVSALFLAACDNAGDKAEADQPEVPRAEVAVTLLENGVAVSPVAAEEGAEKKDSEKEHEVTKGGLLAGTLLPQGQAPTPGQSYDENLSVRNDGASAVYVQVVLDRYWADSIGNKRSDLLPEMIQLAAGEGGQWIEDEAARTPESYTFYYTAPLVPGAETSPLIKVLAINPEVVTQGIQEAQVAKGAESPAPADNASNPSPYNGAMFVLKAKTQAAKADELRADPAALQDQWGVTFTFSSDGRIESVERPKPAEEEAAKEEAPAKE